MYKYFIITSLLTFIFLVNFNFTVYGKSDNKKCLDCHAAINSKPVVHPASEDCDNCHKSKGMSHPQTGEKGFNLTENLPGLCFTCHGEQKDKFDKISKKHGPVNDSKSCSNCHNSHSSDGKKLTLADDNKLCYTCHNKAITVGNRKIVNMKKLIEGSKYVHSAIESGCASCHVAHGSNFANLLIGTFPKSEYVRANKDSFALCFSCHDAELIGAQTTTSATGFRNGDKNLHFLHINGEKGRSCKLCHNIHASNNKFNINETVKFGNMTMKLNYKDNEKGGSCFPGCHGEKQYVR